MAFCTGVMTLVAASSLVVSCYDDSDLRSEIENMKGDLSDLDARVKVLEELKGKLQDLTAKVDALYTLQFQVSDSNELQYSFDGGKTWTGTGIILAAECDCEPCPPCQYVPCDHECPEVSLVDNGDSVTITIGDASFTIEKPQEIVFEIRAGKVYFQSEATQKVTIKSSGIDDITVMSYPKGWYAEIASDGMLEVTAPNYEDTVGEYDYETWEEIPAKCAASGYVKVHACSAEGKCMVGKLSVTVTNRPVEVKAYGGKAYFTSTSNNNWAPEFYYGMSPRESFEAEVAGLLSDLNAEGWSDYAMNDGEFEVVADVAELLGAEPEAGVEYVAWALVSDWNIETYTMDDFVVAYYQVINVTAVEDESQRTAYNVTATVTVEGADKYLALALPANYLDYEGALEEYKMNMVMSLDPDSWSGPMGKYYTESYTGSVLDIAEGTTASMSGNYAPNLDIYLLIIPMDGRAWDEYTVEDIHEFKFTTAALTSGGAVNATAEQVFSYMAEEYDYDIWDYVQVEKQVDRYSQLAVKVEPSATNWVAFYYLWLDDAEWNLYGGDDELLVNRLLQEWGMTPNDVEFPYYDCLDSEPETTSHFVALFVDDAGKYGQLAKISATTEELVYSEIMFTEPYETNLTDGVLKNTTEFMFKPTVEGGTAASFKYYWLQTNYYNPYEGMDDATLATTIHFDRDNRGKVVTADELVDGYMYVPNCEYGSSYMVAVLPYDENGAPGKSAAIFNFESVFSIDGVITEGAEFEATKPAITLVLPEDSEFYPDNNYGDGAYYGYAYQSYYDKYQFYYEVAYTLVPAEATEVCVAYVDGLSYDMTEPAAAKAAKLWSLGYGSWRTVTTSEPFESGFFYSNNYHDAAAPNLYIAASWKDAEGNYYYTEVPFQDKMQYYHDKMYAMIFGEQVATTPDGKQLTFVWEDMMGAPACLDLGVTTPGQLAVCYDVAAVYGEEGLPEEMIGQYMQYMSWEYEVTATDATSGVITIKSYDHFGDVQTAEGTYAEWDGTTCKVTFEMLYLEDVTMTVATETIPVYIEQAGGVM